MIKLYLTADEIAGMLGISKGHAYRVIRGCNEELRAGGYLTVAGKVPRKFFGQKYYGFEEMMKENENASILRQDRKEMALPVSLPGLAGKQQEKDEARICDKAGSARVRAGVQSAERRKS